MIPSRCSVVNSFRYIHSHQTVSPQQPQRCGTRTQICIQTSNRGSRCPLRTLPPHETSNGVVIPSKDTGHNIGSSSMETSFSYWGSAKSPPIGSSYLHGPDRSLSRGHFSRVVTFLPNSSRYLEFPCPIEIFVPTIKSVTCLEHHLLEPCCLCLLKDTGTGPDMICDCIIRGWHKNRKTGIP